MVDAPPDAPSVIDDCVTPLTNQTITLTSVLGIYGRAAFDGKTVWTTYATRELDASGNATSRLDTFAARLDCAGQLVGGPQRISTTASANDTQPLVAVSGNAIMYAWTGELDPDIAASNCTAGSCLRAFVRSYNKNDAASPILFNDKTLLMRYDGTAYNQNVLPSGLAAGPDGHFYITGVRAVSDAPGWTLFLQELDRQGNGVGDAVHPLVETDGAAHGLTSSALYDDTIYVAFEREGANESSWSVALMRLDATDRSLIDTEPTILGAGTRPSFGTKVEANAPLLLAMGTAAATGQAAVLDARLPNFSMTLGSVGNTNVAPMVVARTGGGAVAWMERSGGTTRVRALGFAYDNNTFTQGNEFELTAAANVNYGVSITHVIDDVYFITWSEGVGGNDFRLRGRYIALAQPT